MANINDYIIWRGDLSFNNAPFNDIDNLIFTEFCYLNFDKIVPQNYSDGFTLLSDAVIEYFSKNEDTQRSLGYIIPDDIKAMAKMMAKSPRFASLKLTAFQSITDVETQMQFCAMTILLPDGTAFVAFRGTDDTIVGWREDFNMMYTFPVPSQVCSEAYLCSLMAQFSGDLRLGGHSKGGNLALYAAARCSHDQRHRIIRVYNNDGPGFDSRMISSEGYGAIKDRITRIVPQTSVVGMLFEHEETYRIVKSHAKGIFQHNGFSWEVLGTEFVPFDSLTRDSLIVDKSVHSFLAQMDEKESRIFVESMFEILGASNAETLTDLMKNKNAFLKALKTVPPEARSTVIRTIMKIVAESGHVWLSTVRSKSENDKIEQKADTQKMLKAPEEQDKSESIPFTLQNAIKNLFSPKEK